MYLQISKFQPHIAYKVTAYKRMYFSIYFIIFLVQIIGPAYLKLHNFLRVLRMVLQNYKLKEILLTFI